MSEDQPDKRNFFQRRWDALTSSPPWDLTKWPRSVFQENAREFLGNLGESTRDFVEDAPENVRGTAALITSGAMNREHDDVEQAFSEMSEEEQQALLEDIPLVLRNSAVGRTLAYDLDQHFGDFGVGDVGQSVGSGNTFSGAWNGFKERIASIPQAFQEAEGFGNKVMAVLGNIGGAFVDGFKAFGEQSKDNFEEKIYERAEALRDTLVNERGIPESFVDAHIMPGIREQIEKAVEEKSFERITIELDEAGQEAFREARETAQQQPDQSQEKGSEEVSFSMTGDITSQDMTLTTATTQGEDVTGPQAPAPGLFNPAQRNNTPGITA